MTAIDAQKKRDADDFANHLERVEWLSKDNPCWVDGTPVDAHTRFALLSQSEQAIERYKARGMA